MTEFSENYHPETFDRNLDAFEYGLDFSQMSIQELIERDVRAYFWTFGVVEEALSDGFDLIDEDGNVLPIMDEIDQHLEETQYLQEFRQGVALTRAYGHCGFLHFSNGELKVFKPKDMQLEYDIVKRVFTKATLTEYIAYTQLGYIDHKLETKELSSFFISVFEQRNKTLIGRSVLEPIWDVLNGLFICDFMAALYVARVGGGIKIIKSAHFAGADTTKKAEMLRPIRDLSNKLALGIGLQDEFKLYTGEGSAQIKETVDILYSALAAGTGYPKNLWMGDSLGQLAGAEQSGRKLLEVHKKIQKQSLPYLKKSIKILAEIMGWALPKNFKIEWRFKEKISEEAQANLELIKAQADVINAKIMTGNELRELKELSALPFFSEQEEAPLFFLEQKTNNMKFEIIGDTENESVEPANEFFQQEEPGPESGPEPEPEPESESESF